MTFTRSVGVVGVVLCGALLLAGCASDAGSGAGWPAAGPALDAALPGLPDGEVRGQGTVMDVGGTVELCLGAVAESYPPQCSGVPLEGWSWDGIEGAESSGDTTWGAYAVQGVYDGSSLTVTQPPIMLALYDPMMPDDPTNGEPGPADEATLQQVQDKIHEALGSAALASWPQDGRLWVQVVWDDGTMQDAADATYGDDVVLIRPALNEVG